MKSEHEEHQSDNSLVLLKQYLLRVCPSLLFSENENKALFDNCLNRADAIESLSKFAGSSDASLLLVELTDREGSYITCSIKLI